jgi:hypothetical protein
LRFSVGFGDDRHSGHHPSLIPLLRQEAEHIPLGLFSLQQPDQDYDEMIDDLASTDDDLSGLERLDSDFIELIREGLRKKPDWFITKRKVGKSPARSERAIQILDVLVESVERDAGIGVDEYADRPTHPRYRRTGFRKERARVRQKLIQQFVIPFQKYDEAVSGLRKATDQVIREHGI